MRIIRLRRYLHFLLLGALLWGCSTQKDKWVNRKYHEITAHYNGYFNGNESYNLGVKNLTLNTIEDFDRILPVYIIGEQKDAQAIFSYMDKAIAKSTKVIRSHSMYIKKQEKNAWIDDAYMLMGKARFYKQEYSEAIEVFNFIITRFEGTEAFYEAHWWLARSYMGQKSYDNALYSLDLIDGKAEVPKWLRPELYAVYAQIHYEQELWEPALDFMLKAYSQEPKKERRMRYSFILGQLYQAQGSCNRAIRYYGDVLKLNPTYTFEFNAKIKRALCVDRYNKNNKAIAESLLEMLEDPKNDEYQDQIYYALGELAYGSADVEKALEYFKLSAQTSVVNDKQKAVAYLRVGEILFDEMKYLPAKAYYDSAMMFLPQTYPNYADIKTLNENLSELTDNLVLIQTEDSLQLLAKMNEADRNRVIDNYINELKAEEARKKQEEQMGFNQQMTIDNQNRDRNQGGTQTGAWYFYNPSTVSIGYQEFVRVWGNRKLEDHWRRKNKSVNEDLDNAEEEVEITIGDSTIVANKYDREYYLRFIPLTEEAMAASHEKIRNALINVGVIYKEKLENMRKSAEAFEELIKRYPDVAEKDRIYFNLYRVFASLGYTPESEKYKKLLLEEFPNSEYAQIISDPDYARKKEATENRASKYYAECYQYYGSGNHKKVLQMTPNAPKDFPGDVLLPKFALLEALSTASKGKDALVAKLRVVVELYPGTEEATEARNMIAFFTGEKVNEADGTTEEEVKEGGEEKKELDISMFSDKLDQQHFYILLVPAKGLNLNALNSALSDFNGQFFSMDNLNVKALFLDQNTQMITIRTFAKVDKAKSYYKAIKDDPGIKAIIGDVPYQQFLISLENFNIFYKEKNTEAYVHFFNKYYKN